MIRAAALLAAACSAARADSWPYRVELDPASPFSARVEVELPAERRAQDFSVQVRGMLQHLRPQVVDPRCDGAPLAPDSAGAWRVQGWNCVRLAWTVMFDEASGDSADPRALKNVFDPRLRFWLFSEPTALLRPVGEELHAGEIEFAGVASVHGSAPGARPLQKMVPGRDAAPGLYVIGELPRLTMREGSVETVHIAAQEVDLRELVQQQRRSIRYLTQIMRTRPSPRWRGTVIWLANADHAEPVGVSGFRTLLLSCAVRDGRVLQSELALSILLREQFLQMAPAALPLWVRESLAQFYALKALRRTELPADAVTAAERRFIDPLRAPGITLREAQRRVQSGEPALRSDLHSAGATFWDRLDRAIVRKSGFRTLDSALPRILAAEWTDDRLPPAVLERLYRYAGESAVEDLLTTYVGD